MRTIKFRAWLADEKKMDMHAHMRAFFGPRCEVPNDKEILMQWTGLRDKSGKEIYEGDILKLRALQYEVKYENHGFWCRDGNGIFWPQEKEGEVIGNIWENPELLS